MNSVDLVEKERLRRVPAFRPGDNVKVHVRVVEAGRERVQVFHGVVLRRQGGGLRETFTVRKVSFGVGVERTFPVHSPSIAKIEVVQKGRVRRAKLYYLRELRGKKARIRERREEAGDPSTDLIEEDVPEEAEPEAETPGESPESGETVADVAEEALEQELSAEEDPAAEG